ncbi:helix-turn-helix transcriptional regulator [Streptomyces specialis]|uniref:helix-turn-helix transcriptional regulator n=1 Tax=Streptomyces specialis TaxID=498367 RepID=UPI00099EC9DD|nr:LuxR C-terminal-related transcriptional regulator [Streptomyces specialis]
MDRGDHGSGFPESPYRRMAELAVAVLHERDPGRLRSLVIAELLTACGGDFVVPKAEHWDDRSGSVRFWTADGPQAPCVDEETLARIRKGHPFSDFYASATDRAPSTAGGIAARNRRPGRAVAPLGAEHVLAIPLPESTGPVRGYLVYRSGPDFTGRHLAYAHSVQPLLAGIDRHFALLRSAPGAPVSPEGGPAVTGPAIAYGLTPREAAVLVLLSEALTAHAIGRRLGISVRTVHKHVGNVYRKLGTGDRLTTVLRAQARGLLPTPARGVPEASGNAGHRGDRAGRPTGPPG